MHPDDFEDTEQTRLDEINERYSDLRERPDPTYAEPFDPPIKLMDMSLPDSIDELLEQNGIEIDHLPDHMQNTSEMTWEHAMNIVNAAAFAHWATDGRVNWGNLHNHGNRELIECWLNKYSAVLTDSASPEDFIDSDMTEVMSTQTKGSEQTHRALDNHLE